VTRAVSETVDTLRHLLRPRPIRWDVPPVPLVGRGDDARFRQVLEQLLENESKYAPPGDGVSMGAWRDDREVFVYVTDDGPGIPATDWESVFEPFVRRDAGGATRSRVGRGSGIGLFAARRLMDAMGGRVWIEPNGFGGSRFVVALPAG
jgi:two-component system, OmpR family, sensor histidine kinase KdpD